MFVDKIEKALSKLAPKEKKWVSEILERLSSGKIDGLDIKNSKEERIFFVFAKGI